MDICRLKDSRFKEPSEIQTMMSALELCLFLFYFSTITADISHKKHHLTLGGCTWKEVADEDLKLDSHLRDGRQHILDSRMQYYIEIGYNDKGYNITLNISNLQVCKQLVAGWFYHFAWLGEDVIKKCVDETICDPKENPVSNSKLVNCTAGYVVQPWTNSSEFLFPECKKVL